MAFTTTIVHPLLNMMTLVGFCWWNWYTSFGGCKWHYLNHHIPVHFFHCGCFGELSYSSSTFSLNIHQTCFYNQAITITIIYLVKSCKCGLKRVLYTHDYPYNLVKVERLFLHSGKTVLINSKHNLWQYYM